MAVAKLRSNLVPAENDSPPSALPTEEMISEGLAQLQEAAAESGADAVQGIFAWILVEQDRTNILGFEENKTIPKGVVLQGVAVRYLTP